MSLLPPYNHQNDNQTGITPSRLVYAQKRDITPGRLIQDRTTKRPSADKLKRDAEVSEEKLNKMRAKLANFASEYNKHYGTKPEQPYGKPIKIDYNYPSKTIRQIDSILNAEYVFDGIEYKLSERVPSDKRLKQPAALLQLKKLLEEYKKVAGKSKEVKEVQVKSSKYAIVERDKRVREILDAKTKFEKSPAYNALLKDYKDVFSNLISGRDAEFRRFYEKADGTIDSQKERENRQLFFAILASETNNFSTDFIFKNFTDDPEQNKKNYPFIYNEWVKGQFDKTKIDTAKKKVDIKTKEAGLTTPNASTKKVEDRINFLNKKFASYPSLPHDLQLANPLKKLPAKRDFLYYDALTKALETLQTDISFAIDKLEKGSFKGFGKNQREAFIKRLKRTKNEFLPLHIALAKAQYDYERYQADLGEIDKRFTKKELRKTSNRQIVLELAMKKFQKAMQVIDQPFKRGGDFSRIYHPAVRRMLIATVYREGVAKRTPSGEYIDDVSEDYTWLISKLAQSSYFYGGLTHKVTKTVKDANGTPRKVTEYKPLSKFLSAEQREFLILGRYANLAYTNEKFLRDDIIKKLETEQKARLERLSRLLALKRSGRITPAQQTQIDNDVAKIDEITSRKITERNVETVIRDEKVRLALWVKFRQETEKLMANPDRKKIRAFIEKMKRGRVFSSEVDNKKVIEAYAKYAETVDLTYNALDFQEKSTGNYLERMGIYPEGLYKAYLSYWKKHPDMKVDQWDTHFRTSAGKEKLIKMFRAILPESSVYKGKEDFLRIFATLHGKNPLGTKPELSKDQAIALNIFQQLKVEIQHRDKIGIATQEGFEAAKAKLEGMTFGDKITDYARGVVNMLIGPGQSIANRAAGAALLIMAWKLAKKAYKGEGNSGKALRVLFLAGAAELALKHVTGEGVLDKLRLTGVVNALEEKKTYESVLLARAREKFKKDEITPNQHARALMKLRDVPFKDVMEWYEATKQPGDRKEVPEERRLPRNARLSFLKISPYDIVGGSVKNEGLRRLHARKVLRKTIENFFDYVGNKEQGSATTGKNILSEIWIKSIKDPGFNLKKAQYTRRLLPPQLREALQKNPRSVTWRMVMYAEIRPSDTPKDALDEAKDYLQGKAMALSRWTRRHIEQEIGAGAKEFWRNMDTRYVPKLKNFVGKLGEAGATKLRYGKRYIELLYEGNKYEIRQFGRQHWEFVATVVKFPFKLIYAADQAIVPFITTKMRQMEEIVRSDKLVTIPHNRELALGDIMNPTLQAQVLTKTLTNPLDRFDIQKNPGFSYFGMYQIPFYRAWDNKKSGGDAYYESKGDGFDGLANVGYFVSETTQKDADTKATDSIENRYLAMKAKSREQAKAHFMGKGVPAADIDKYMYPVHIVSQNAGKDSKTPNKIYRFWRMPLVHSKEYQLKKLGRWPDYYNPNEYKHRPPFILDPSKGILENLKAAYGFNSPALRKGFGYATIAVAQWLRIIMGALEGAGTVTKGIARTFKVDERRLGWINDLTKRDETTLQAIDEWLGSAQSKSLALSAFYKNPKNAENYKKAIDYARRSGKELNLETKPDGTPYTWSAARRDTGKAGRARYETIRGRLNPEDYKATKKPATP